MERATAEGEARPGYGPELKTVWADLHLHTVASACAEIEMIPPLIARRASKLGLGLIAVTDHHTVDNVVAVQRAAADYDIRVLAGMEVEAREDVHIVCLFEGIERALAWQETVYAHLPALLNREELFGAQYVVDETGDYIQSNDRLLATSVDLTVAEVVAQVRALGGQPFLFLAALQADVVGGLATHDPLFDHAAVLEMLVDQACHHIGVDVPISDARLARLLDIHERLARAHANAAHGAHVRRDATLVQLLQNGLHRLARARGDAAGAHAHDHRGARVDARRDIVLYLIAQLAQLIQRLYLWHYLLLARQ